MIVKTGIYVRVSTEEQAQEGFSIRGQTEKLKSYALLKDWELYDIYAEACDIIEPLKKPRKYKVSESRFYFYKHHITSWG